ncbi:MAG TPA: deoxyguanosinetriphosphate triphosphohydrolase [Clostridiales bacterium]|nr:deoxyguanosinetriphosphate triphosphohydrolase [Clostridiales bacterium]
MLVRERTQMWESMMLSPYAALSKNTKGRQYPDDECDLRTCYQRDRDRITHSKSFRRLKHKTQVFLSPEGDHYRTRLTHTLEVSQIARTIARALALNEDLTEAIALGHDLGHTPFGHAGERALDKIASCGFRHYEQSVRVVDKLEKEGNGLNLTYEVRNGILCHTKGTQADTLEGQVVRIADRIAYINHDIDDAIRGGVISEKDIPSQLTNILGNKTSQRINTLVLSLVKNSDDGVLLMDNDVQQAFDTLHQYMFDTVYKNPYAKSEERKIPDLVAKLFNYFMSHSEMLDPTLQQIVKTEGCERGVCDYIAGMSDQYAIHLYQNLFIPKNWQKEEKDNLY